MAVAGLPRNNALDGLCERVLVEIGKYWGVNNPETLKTHVGTLEFLHSPQNLAGVSLMEDDMRVNSAGYTEIRARYMQRGIESQISEDRTELDCTGTEEDFLEKTIAVDGWVGSPEIKLSMDQLRQLCEPTDPMGAAFARRITLYFDAMRRKIEEQVLNDLTSGCIGVNINNLVSDTASAAAKSITILNADGDNLNNGINTLFIDFSDMSYSGPIHLVGQGNIERFWLNAGRGCCNDAGFDQSRAVDGLNLWKSIQTNSLLGENQFLAFAPGVFQHFTVNPYRGFGMDMGTVAYRTIVDPILGIEYGMKVKFDANCDDAWVINFGAWTGTCCIPDDQFRTGDRLEDTNGITRWTAAQAS